MDITRRQDATGRWLAILSAAVAVLAIVLLAGL
jgi:hypothetical protein